jgi:succinyl-diaminopimelate desuccinylase
MKAALAAMVVACERFLAQYPHPAGSLGFLITSDEEGPAQDGTVRVVEWLRERGEHPQYCLVGEPSSRERLGDMAKNGRRGSLHGHLRLLGVQGHVAYPHLAENPIHGVGDIIRELSTQVWDQGDESFPPTSFQISNIQGGTGAVNVIPGEVDLRFNFRFSPAVSVQQLRERVETIIQRQLLDREVEAQQRYGYELDWHLSGMPFITRDGALLEAVAEATREVTGLRPEFSTTGGTSDGRFIAPLGTQVVELGHVNSTIHKINECVDLADVERLTDIYERLLVRLLAAR